MGKLLEQMEPIIRKAMLAAYKAGVKEMAKRTIQSHPDMRTQQFVTLVESVRDNPPELK